jgi:hypothetical protein
VTQKIGLLSHVRHAGRAIVLALAVLLVFAGADAAHAATSLAVNGTVSGVAALNVPASVMAVANDDSTVYVADGYAHQVLALDIATDHVSTFAGNGTPGDSGDGAGALAAELEDPTALGVDHWGNVVIQDSQANVYRVVAEENCGGSCPYGLPTMVTGDIYTIVGGAGGSSTFSRPANGSVARTTMIEQLFSYAWTGTDQFGDLIFSSGSNNRDVFIVSGQSCSSSCPYGFESMTAGDTYWVAGNDFAGNPSAGNSGNGGLATAAEFETPTGFAVDSAHDILIADANTNEIRLVAGHDCSSSCPFALASMTAGHVYSVAASAGSPEQLYLDGEGNLIVGDPLNFNVSLIAASNCSSSCPYGLSALTEGQLYPLEGPDATTIMGGPLAHLASGTIAEAAGLTLDPKANLFVEDESTNELDEIQMKAAVATPIVSAGAPAVAIGATSVSHSHRKAAVKLTCTVAPCSGEVELTASFKVAVKAGAHANSARRETFVLGKAAYSLAAGASTTVSLKLSALTRQALHGASKHRPLHATVSVSVAGGASETKAVKLA